MVTDINSSFTRVLPPSASVAAASASSSTAPTPAAAESASLLCSSSDLYFVIFIFIHKFIVRPDTAQFLRVLPITFERTQCMHIFFKIIYSNVDNWYTLHRQKTLSVIEACRLWKYRLSTRAVYGSTGYRGVPFMEVPVIVACHLWKYWLSTRAVYGSTGSRRLTVFICGLSPPASSRHTVLHLRVPL
jgi:hypothetical protein